MAEQQKNPDVKAKNLTEEDRAFVQENAEGLSDTTVKYGKWIHTPEEHADRPGQSLVTRSHDVIQAWAQARDARPATIPTQQSEQDGRPHVLRFLFGDRDGERLQELGWEEFFQVFDDRELVFLFQEQKSDGSPSNFFRFDNPHREDA